MNEEKITYMNDESIRACNLFKEMKARCMKKTSCIQKRVSREQSMLYTVLHRSHIVNLNETATLIIDSKLSVLRENHRLYRIINFNDYSNAFFNVYEEEKAFFTVIALLRMFFDVKISDHNTQEIKALKDRQAGCH